MVNATLVSIENEEKKDDVRVVDRQWLRKLLRKHLSSTPGFADTGANENDHTAADEPLYVLAPMVDQSDLPFRLLCRRYGVQLCFTPMIHAKLFIGDPKYRSRFHLDRTPAQDRPLIAQICGGDPEAVLQTCLLIEPYCDGIDINCGCPQAIAKRGFYGAFLLEQEDYLLELVHTLLAHLTKPLSIKVRLLFHPERPDEIDLDASLRLYRKLVDAGIHMLSVHGRTRLNKGPSTGAADWNAIRRVVQEFGSEIPILANGSIASVHDAHECLRVTGADGIMSAEALLEYPPLFAGLGHRIGRLQLANDYMNLCREYPPDQGGQGSSMKCIRIHLHRLLHADLNVHTDIRDRVVLADTMQELQDCIDQVQRRQEEAGHDVQTEEFSWYMRHRQPWFDDETGQVMDRIVEQKRRERNVKHVELEDDAAACFDSLFG